ncbi:cytochrome b561 [Agaricicola taiwanensis]|uniref:Cytochrome b561 n=2 Tax=Agaricicola taiwanensis TaxID=591372 RepID=A0A8J2VM82_9RHOB|nr:cytochrome b561 [Agaricicola taiwanensis]
MRSARMSYPPLAKLLHWLVAVLVIVLIVLGLLLGSFPEGAVQNTAYDLHKSLGFTLLLLMIARLANRLIAGVPPSEPTIERWQIAASHAVHGLLYLALFAQPIIGLIANSAFGAPLNLFWLIEVPPLIDKNEELADRLFDLHETLGFIIAGLAAVHIAAALYHYFIRKDGVLQRMAPEGWA